MTKMTKRRREIAEKVDPEKAYPIDDGSHTAERAFEDQVQRIV